MYKMIAVSCLLLSVSTQAQDDGIVDIIDYVDSSDSCIFYQDETCVLTEEQALINMQENESDKSICLANYKDKCILNKEQAKKSYANARKGKRFDSSKRSLLVYNPSSISGHTIRDLRADAMLTNRK
ncbi:MAG: hypothetical protein HWE16_10765 [Gammaproteobacteria bacterium]|nr:hypothetical protein [Gammaproteobacteria bacterium]